jgi:lipopolysaccharide export system protein LptA
MTRGKRAAQAAIRIAAVAFLVGVAVSYRSPSTRAGAKREEIAATLASEAGGVHDRVRFRGFDRLETRAAEGRYRLRAAEALGYEEKGDRIFLLKDVVFESQEGARDPPAASGAARSMALTAPRAEFVQGSGAVRVFDGVRIEGESTVVHGASFRYDPVTRRFLSDGAVTAMRGSLAARAASGQLETRGGVLLLEGDVRVRGYDEAGRPLEMAAPSVTWTREGRLAAKGGVRLRREDSVLRGETFERAEDPAGDRVRAAGPRTLVLFLPGEGAEAAPAGSLGRSVLLSESSSVELLLEKNGGPPSRVDIEGGEGGDALLLVAPEARSGARKALAPRFAARLAGGKLAEITVPEALETWESGEPGGPPGSGLKSATAGFARFTFGADGRSLEVATLEKGVTYRDGTRASLTAPLGTLRGPEKTAVFAGDDAHPVDYRDAQGTLVARTVTYDRGADRVDAAGHVRAMYAGERRASLLGGTSTEPLFSESDVFRLDGPRHKLTLTGAVRAWQGENVLKGGVLVLDDAARTLHAETDVHVFFRRRQQAPGSPAPKGSIETVNASGDTLNYRESDRFAHIEGNANVVSGIWTIASDATDIRLSPEKTVEYAEARGSVRLEDRELHRRGEGKKATWRPQTDVVTLDGAPAVAIDGKGNRLTGASLTFRQGRSRVEVESSADVGSEAVLKPEGSS